MTVVGVLTAIGNREPWQAQALCAQADGGDAWFPERGGSPRDAKRVCALCPVAAECLSYALRTDQRFGVWGGLTEFERKRIRRGSRPCVTRSLCGTEAGIHLHYRNREQTCRPCRDAAAARMRQRRGHTA